MKYSSNQELNKQIDFTQAKRVPSPMELKFVDDLYAKADSMVGMSGKANPAQTVAHMEAKHRVEGTVCEDAK